MAWQAACARKVRKLYVKFYISIVNLLQTDTHAQAQTKTPLALEMVDSVRNVDSVCTNTISSP